VDNHALYEIKKGSEERYARIYAPKYHGEYINHGKGSERCFIAVLVIQARPLEGMAPSYDGTDTTMRVVVIKATLVERKLEVRQQHNCFLLRNEKNRLKSAHK